MLSEAINNPLRLLAGWFMATSASIAPGSLLLSYWMIGCYFMAIKRFAECRNLGDNTRIAAYRKSLAFFNEQQLLVAIMFYGSSAMLFFGAFVMRYRLEVILSFPLVAAVMASYLSIAFKEDSAAQHPEKLYREPGLMTGSRLYASDGFMPFHRYAGALQDFPSYCARRKPNAIQIKSVPSSSLVTKLGPSSHSRRAGLSPAGDHGPDLRYTDPLSQRSTRNAKTVSVRSDLCPARLTTLFGL